MAIETKDVQLKGRVVTIRELTAADELNAVKLLSKEMNGASPEASEVQNFNVMFGLSICKIDGEFLPTPATFDELVGRMAKFNLKELRPLKQAFIELNTPDDDFLEEPTN